MVLCCPSRMASHSLLIATTSCARASSSAPSRSLQCHAAAPLLPTLAWPLPRETPKGLTACPCTETPSRGATLPHSRSWPSSTARCAWPESSQGASHPDAAPQPTPISTPTPTPTHSSQDSFQDQGRAAVGPAPARRPRQPSSCWLNLWETRLGTKDRTLLLRTLPRSDNMSTGQPFAADLSTLGAAAMTRQPFSRMVPRATRPRECAQCDLLSISIWTCLPLSLVCGMG
jgi:hypothetical protein